MRMKRQRLHFLRLSIHGWVIGIVIETYEAGWLVLEGGWLAGRTSRPSSYAKAKKAKSLTFHTHNWLSRLA